MGDPDHRTLRAVAGAAAVLLAVLVALGAERPPSVPVGPDGTVTGAVADRGAVAQPGSPPLAATSLPGGDGGPAAAVAIGGVTGVSVAVAPRADLDDGATVRIAIDGMAHLPRPAVARVCRTDGADEVGPDVCDAGAVHPAGAVGDEPDDTAAPDAADEPAALPVAAAMRVGLDRVLDLAGGPYDCAVELAGCVLVLAAAEAPARGIVVPLSFRRPS